MADNIAVTPGAGATVATDDVAGVQYQRVKLDVGADGASTPVVGTLPVSDGGGSLTVDGTVAVSGSVTVADGGGSLTVDNPALSVVGGGAEATALRVTIANDSTGVLSVDDNGGSLTVDGTVAISGTVAVTDNAGSLTIDSPGIPTALGQTTMSASMPVAIASDQSTINVSIPSGGATGFTITDNNAFSDGTSKVVMAGYAFDEVAGTALTENDAAAARVDSKRAQVLVMEDATTRGQRAAVSAAGRLSVDASGVAVPVTDNAGSLTVDNGGTFAVQVTSTTPGTGATNLGKAEDAAHTSGDVGVMALAVRNDAGTVLAGTDLDYVPLTTDSSGALRVAATGGGGGGTSSSYGSAFPAAGTAAGFSDGTNMQGARVFDADSGAGTQYVAGVSLRKIASGGSVEAGTSSDPLRVDPTGTTTQPVSDAGGSITVDQATGSNLHVAIDSGTVTTITNVVHVDDNAGSLTVDNGGTFAVQDSQVIADNAAFTDGTSKLFMGGYIFDETAGTALTENDAAAARVNANRAQVLTIEDSSTRGQRAAVSAAGRLSVDASGVPVPVTDNAGSLTVDAPVATPVFVRLSDGAAAISALPVTDNAGSLTVDNAGTFAVQDSQVIADDSAFTVATSKVFPAGYMADETSTDSVDEGDAGVARMTLDRKVITAPHPHTQGGLLIHKNLDVDETEDAIKATRGQVYGWFITNRATTPRYVKFYNDTVANVVVGTTAPVITIEIPGNSTDHIAANALGGIGIEFNTAITIAATTGFADADTGAPGTNDVIATVFYF